MPTFAKAFFLLPLTLLFGCATLKPPVYTTQAVTQPTPFAPGVISTEGNSEFDITFTPDGREAYFTRRAPGEKQHIYRTTFAGGRWSVPTRLFLFYGSRRDAVHQCRREVAVFRLRAAAAGEAQ